MNTTAQPSVQKILYRVPDLTLALGISRTEIYRRIQNGTFPKGHKIGTNTVVWRREEVEHWANQLVPSDVP